MTKTYVVGHLNPDTDSIASAIAYSWLLSTTMKGDVIPARCGSLNKQTSWLLERLGVEPPMLITDVSPLFGSISRPLESLAPERPLTDAWPIDSVAPLVDSDGKPQGMITGMSLFAFLGELLGDNPEQKSISDIFAKPCIEAADKSEPR